MNRPLTVPEAEAMFEATDAARLAREERRHEQIVRLEARIAADTADGGAPHREDVELLDRLYDEGGY